MMPIGTQVCTLAINEVIMCNLKTKSLDELVAMYIKVRDGKAETEAKHKEELKPITEALQMLEDEVHERLKAMKVSSVRTPAGTAYTKMTRSVKVFDKSLFMDFVKIHQAFDMLDVRANKTAVEDYVSQNDELPPGVDCVAEESVGFRRA